MCVSAVRDVVSTLFHSLPSVSRWCECTYFLVIPFAATFEAHFGALKIILYPAVDLLVVDCVCLFVAHATSNQHCETMFVGEALLLHVIASARLCSSPAILCRQLVCEHWLHQRPYNDEHGAFHFKFFQMKYLFKRKYI